jgi:hypothetical protein
MGGRGVDSEESIQMHLREVRCDNVDWIYQVQDRNQRKEFSYKLLNIRAQMGVGAIRRCNFVVRNTYIHLIFRDLSGCRICKQWRVYIRGPGFMKPAEYSK